jgi:hypothetical protein
LRNKANGWPHRNWRHRLFSLDAEPVEPGAALVPGILHYELQLAADGAQSFRLRLEAAGRLALFTQHHPDEFALRMLDPTASRSAGGRTRLQPRP